MTLNTLRHVDATRPAGAVRRAYAAFSATRVVRFVSRHVGWKLDPFLLRVTGGRISTTLFIASGLLETTGARTGQPRRHAVIYFHDGERVTIVASNAGSPHHPAWYFNVKAHPDVMFAGVPMRATVIGDETERDRLWKLADNVFPAYATYRRDAAEANRTIPIIQLTG